MNARTWLVVADDAAIGGLVDVARALGGPVGAVVVGDRALADAVAPVVDRVDWFGTCTPAPAEAWAGAVAEHLTGAGGRGAASEGTEIGAVLAGTGPASRVVLGAVAARLRAPVLSGVRSVEPDGDALLITRLVCGGIALEHDRVTGPVGLLLEGGARIEPDAAREPAPVREVTGAMLPVTCTDEGTPPPATRDLAAAARVIGVGRGLRGPQELDRIAELARLIGAEVACSRPVAEDLGWLPRGRYLGVSGRRIAPRLYLALGISGQLQHMIGVRDAGTIVAVNTDPRAPVLEAADVSIVGDLHAIVPALIQELERAR